MDLNFKINKQTLVLSTNLRKDCNKLIRDSNNYLNLYFDFMSSDWLQTEKYVIITDQNDKNYEFLLNDGEPIILNADITKNIQFDVSVYGTQVIDGEEDFIRITTNKYTIKLGKSGYTTDISPIEPVSPDVFEDIYYQLSLKSEIGHTHLVNDITDFNDGVEENIDDFATELKNKLLE